MITRQILSGFVCFFINTRRCCISYYIVGSWYLVTQTLYTSTLEIGLQELKQYLQKNHQLYKSSGDQTWWSSRQEKLIKLWLKSIQRAARATETQSLWIAHHLTHSLLCGLYREEKPLPEPPSLSLPLSHKTKVCSSFCFLQLPFRR